MLFFDDDYELPDTPDEDEVRLAGELGAAGLRAIDGALQRYTRASWLKIARVVHEAIKAGGFTFSDDGALDLHVRRLMGLVDSGVIEAQGDVRRPRRSEVRQPAAASRAEPPPAPASDLTEAVMAGDVARAKRLVEGGANVSEPDRHGWTPLHHAAHVASAELLEKEKQRR